MLKRLLHLSLIVPLMLTVPSPAILDADAAVINNQSANFQMYVPDAWSREVDGNKLIIKSDDDNVFIFFYATSADNIEEAAASVGEEFGEMIENMEANHEEPKQTEVNGFTAVYNSGTGVYEGDEVQWEFTILLADMPIVIFSVARNDGFSVNEEALVEMRDSMAPME